MSEVGQNKFMKKNAVITTYYCNDCLEPSKDQLKKKFNIDGETEDIFVNFSSEFDPFHIEKILDVGLSKRKDLVFGKIFQLRKFIEQQILGKYDNLLHIDYSDTKFVKSSEDLFQNFIESEKDIVVSTEKNCWPYLDVVSSWFNGSLPIKEFHYINSGAIISKTEKFYEIIQELEKICLTTKIDFWDDQGVWQYYYLIHNNLNIDTKCQFFFSTADLDESYYKLENNIITTKFGTQPYLIHDNSSFSLNLIQKI